MPTTHPPFSQRFTRSRLLIVLAVTALVAAVGVVAISQLSPAEGYAAEFDGTLTADNRTATHTVTVAAASLKAELIFQGSTPVTGTKELTASLTLKNADNKVLKTKYGTSALMLDQDVPAGTYTLVVSTRWPLRLRDLTYDLSVTSAAPPPGTTSPTTSPSASSSPSTSASSSPSTTTSPTASSTSATPTASGTPSPTGSPTVTTSPSGSPTATTTPPPGGDLTQAACGTWVLYQVSSAADLDRLRPKIEDALALPGVVGFSVRFPWDAADMTGSDESDPILETAKDITERQGKALSIRFMAGAHTPARVFDAGASYYLSSGDKVPLPWDNSTGKHQVFLDAYGQYVGKLAAWSRANDVSLLHLSWYGQDWAELNHGAELRAAAGYSEAAWLDGHRDLIDVAARHSSPNLAVELPLSGYGPLSGGESAALADHVIAKAGANSEQFFIQANGWDETQDWGSPDSTVEAQFDRIWAKPVNRGLQMIQPDGYQWARVFDQLEKSAATYGEIYLPSFWQVPGPTASFDNNSTSKIADLESEIAAFSKSRC